MKKEKNVRVEYETPQVSCIQFMTEQVCVTSSGSGSSGSGSILDDMYETEGGWASLGN